MYTKKHDISGVTGYYQIVLCVAFAAFIVNVDEYIVNIALPTIADNFRVGAREASWITLSYMLAIVSTMLFFGKVADTAGLRNVFVAGYALFALGSLLCGFANDLTFLVLSRSIQGLGGSMLYISGYAIISAFVPDGRRGRAFGIISTAVGLGLMLSSPLGGFITEYLSWHWVFLVNVPFCIFAILLSLKVIPDGKNQNLSVREGFKRFDIQGALLCFTGLFALVFALNKGAKTGWYSPSFIIPMIISVCAISMFVINEKRHPNPIMNLDIFFNKNFVVGNMDSFAVLVFFTGSNFLLPFFLEKVKGFTSSQTGLSMLVYSVVYVCIAPFAGRLSDTISARTVSSIAILSGAAASIFFGLAMHMDSILPVIAYLLWLAVSMAFFFPANNNMVMGSISQKHAGTGAGTFWTFCHIGFLMGVCSYGATFSISLPEGLSDVSAHTLAGISKDTLIGAFKSAFLFGGALGICALFVHPFLRKG